MDLHVDLAVHPLRTRTTTTEQPLAERDISPGPTAKARPGAHRSGWAGNTSLSCLMSVSRSNTVILASIVATAAAVEESCEDPHPPFWFLKVP